MNRRAQDKLLDSEDFQKSFSTAEECNAFVVSVDIRRSTELMLKARSPQQFAHFITTLCTELETIVKDNYGVVDKFTGDGILAFFPEFFAGEDAGFYAIAVADRCHRIFREKYREFRNSFTSVLNKKISEQFSACCSFQETELDIKHEGSMLAYEVRLYGKQYTPRVPTWVKLDGDHE